MGFKDSQYEIKKNILADIPLIYVKTEEEEPVVKSLIDIAEKTTPSLQVFTWKRGGGLFAENFQPNLDEKEVRDPMKVLSIIKQYDRDAVFILHDFHIWLEENKDYVLNLKDTVQSFDKTGTYEQDFGDKLPKKYVIITSPVKKIPREIQKMCSVVEFDLPNYDDAEGILNQFLASKKEKITLSKQEKKNIIQASLGLTKTEILSSYRKALIANPEKIEPSFIVKEKKQIIQKDGLLNYIESTIKMEDAGGLTTLTDWIKKRKIIFNDRVREQYNIGNPKGILLTGVPGTGKSYSAKMIANFLDMPLLGLDVGGLMSMWVGESEENLNKALRVVETVAPCVLWIDEFDKAIPDLSGNQTQETTKRMMSTLLTWLQEKKEKIFVIATANNIHHLPPEIMRKGRFDEIFFVDLPSEKERKEIFHIHLKKKELDLGLFDLDMLAKTAKGFSGAEIEAVINEGCILAASNEEAVMNHHILQEIDRTNPLSETMKEDIEAIQEWAKEYHIRKAN